MSIVLRRSLEAARTQRLREFSDQSDTSLNETSVVDQLSKILLDGDRGMRGVSIPPMVSGMIV